MRRKNNTLKETEKDLLLKISKTKVSVLEYVVTLLEEYRSDYEFLFLRKQFDIFKKEFELIEFAIKNDDFDTESRVFDIIEEHLKSLDLFLKKKSSESRVFGASGSEDSGGVRR